MAVFGLVACEGGVTLPEPPQTGIIGDAEDGVSWGTDDPGNPSTDDATAPETSDPAEDVEPPKLDVEEGDSGPGPGSDSGTPTGPQPGELGFGCDDNDECYSGWCVDSPAGDVCTKVCEDNDSCPLGWACREVAAGGDPTFICVPNDTNLCRPCTDDADCNVAGFFDDGVCVGEEAGPRFCSRLCSDETPCPEGLDCAGVQPFGPDGPTLDLCYADGEVGDVCSCTTKFVETGASTVCQNSNEFGACTGVLTCVEEGPLPECTAATPTAEVCNGIDDDCDGETDEEALDCTTYYLDTDGDGWGQGVGDCLCAKPGDKWLTQGGDCNELVTNVNPGVDEACNGLDDNCDGVTDEEDAVGCIPQFQDLDGDGYGAAQTAGCFCAETEGWSPEGTDCNDSVATIAPSVEESCDGVDNDCDGATDEVGAVGCNPFFLDQDGDGFGLSDKVKCLCGPTGVYTTSTPNDCDDTSAAVNPNALELCNGVDDNCNDDEDEGEPASMCPQVANGLAGCVEGTCDLIACDDGWSNADGVADNGCECSTGGLDGDNGGQTCAEATVLGNIFDDGGELMVTDNVVPETDEDWYVFTAVDGADPGGCDTFRLRVDFLHNPQEQFQLDVYEGSCAFMNQICQGVQGHEKNVSLFQEAGPEGEPLGECPCTPEEEATSDGVQLCSDQTETYWIRVYRKADAQTSCAAYTLRVRNGY